MNLRRITALLLFSTMTLGFGCSTANNALTVNPVADSTVTSTSFNNNRNIVTDDSEMRGTNLTSSRNSTKLASENITKNSQAFTFKTVQVKKGRTITTAQDADSFKVSGAINYPDDKNRLKAGANITVNLSSGGKVVASALTDENGAWSVSLEKSKFSGKAITSIFQFSNKYWTVTGKSQAYQWQGPQIDSLGADTDTGVISPVAGSENAKAAFINDIYNRYLAFFKKEGVEINSWWSKPIKTVWPMNANYYSWGTVNLTDADHWDVNGHEIGHAMTDIGTNSDMGGGQHKIDECYGEDLAWSEGFATFLSGAVSLTRDDADAKFEFLVPRRAPIRMENVPEDVCKGQKNEWRVSAAMWDLYDNHLDGADSAELSFKTIWSGLNRKDRKIGSMKDAANSIKEMAPKDLSAVIDSSNTFNTMF